MKIKLVNAIGTTGFPATDKHNDEAFELAKAYVKRHEDAMLKLGYKTVEFDTIGGLYLGKKRAGRLIALTTMHVLRLMKR